MRKYVIWVSENDSKHYVQVTDSGTKAVPDKQSATPLPNRVVASSVVAAIKPAIKKQNFNVEIGIELL